MVNRQKIDWVITLLSMLSISGLSALFFIMPEESNRVLSSIRFFFGDTMGTYYLVVGLGIFLISLYFCCSHYGNIVLGDKIDLLAVFALLAGTATTFSVATPLMSIIIQNLLGISLDRNIITIAIIFLTCAIYTYSLLHGFKGISILAKVCIYMFGGLMAFVLLAGGESKYIIETGLESFGRMIQNFISLATYTDPLRETNFPQDLTIYYWAYWMVWCVAAPFFIGNISRGRTIRQVIAGGYFFGVGATLTSFIVLGNYSMGLQTTGTIDFIAQYTAHGDIYAIIIGILHTLPLANIATLWVLATMILFYATSFDSIAYTASCYSYKKIESGLQHLIYCLSIQIYSCIYYRILEHSIE